MQETNPSPRVIAVDGPSASGKGTIARRLAAHFDFAYLDTGLLYRAVGLLAHVGKVNLDNPAAVASFAQAVPFDQIIGKMSDPSLRTDTASQAASKVAMVPEVRAILLQFQRDFASHPPQGKKGAVLDGRDIGTTIVPNAPAKIYVVADVEVRARRRWKELQERNETATYDAVLMDLRARDARDSGRAASPALPAADAVKLDNSSGSVDEVFARALAIVQSRLV